MHIIRSRWTLPALVTASLMGCGLPAEPTALPPFEVAEPWQPTAMQWKLTTEKTAARTGWMEWEQRTAQLADVQVSSAAGQPTDDGTPVQLHRRAYVNRHETQGAVVVVPGFTEGLTLYQEVIHDLVANGYSVYVQDHRGQGFSTRFLPGTLGHMDRFDRLVDDLAAYVDEVAAKGAHVPNEASKQASIETSTGATTHPPTGTLPGKRPLFALAHSMGGAVLAGVLERQGKASSLTAVAMVTPMFEPATAAAGAQGWADQALQGWCHNGATSAHLPAWLGQKQVAGKGFERDRDAFLQAVQNQASPSDKAFELSHSAGRLHQRWLAREARCEGAHCGHADARVAGPTLHWVLQACHASAMYREAAAQVARPVLLLNGGQDTVVLTAAQQAFCAQVNVAHAGRCTGVTWPQARHGLLVERDEWRNAAMVRMLAFFESSK